MNNKPPIGVIGPMILVKEPTIDLMASRYNEPEKHRIPPIKKCFALVKYF